MAKEKKTLGLDETSDYLENWLESIVDSIEHHNLDASLVQTEIEAVSYLFDIVQNEDTKGGVESELILDLQFLVRISDEPATKNGTSREAVIKASEIYQEIAGIWFYERDVYNQLIEDAGKAL